MTRATPPPIIVTDQPGDTDNEVKTFGIEGMDEAQSKPLLQKLFWTAWQPEVQCRFRWRPGSVAVWDNRSSQHYPVADYWPETRGMERITVALRSTV